ncbi:hypothetical protein BCR43DRAFT_517704 [Syncephalastrum racemosum]|uniref:Uncharacterized protein n=1 Tax=Syncephalastrum racemosum TaxID=13706 RepID=A0A1X2H522_SYNRA|nr:hypothetical protein BCR43DRAFT_517704 [Syncephalastrum racemosum]
MLVSFSLLILGFSATTQLALAAPARDRVRHLSPAELEAFENPPPDAGMLLPEYGEKFVPDLAASDATVTHGEAAEDADDEDEDDMEAFTITDDDDEDDIQAAGGVSESDTYNDLIYDDDILDESEQGYTFDASPDYEDEEPVGPADDYDDAYMDDQYA